MDHVYLTRRTLLGLGAGAVLAGLLPHHAEGTLTMTARDDILQDWGVVAQQMQAAQTNFLGLTPDKATVLAALNAAQSALTDSITKVNAYDFGGILTIAPYPNPFQLTQNVPFSYQFVAQGGTAPYHFLNMAGTIPAGLTLSSSGLLAGTPLSYPGTQFNFVLGVIDAAGGSYQAAVWLKMAP